MARIRTIKPEFWQDEKLSPLPPLVRLVFIGLISQADDAGRVIDNVKLLDGLLFPATEDTCKDALDALAELSRIIRYRGPSGQPLIQIANWNRHQKVDKPGTKLLPAPPTQACTGHTVTDGSGAMREGFARVQRTDVGYGNEEVGSIPPNPPSRTSNGTGGDAQHRNRKANEAEAFKIVADLRRRREEVRTPTGIRYVFAKAVQESLTERARRAFDQVGGLHQFAQAEDVALRVLTGRFATVFAYSEDTGTSANVPSMPTQVVERLESPW